MMMDTSFNILDSINRPAPAPVTSIHAPPAGIAQSPPSDTSSNEDKHRQRREAVEAAFNRRVEQLLSTNLRLRINTDPGTGNFVYQSVDRQTGEVIKQWPSEAVLRMMTFFNEREGLFFDRRT